MATTGLKGSYIRHRTGAIRDYRDHQDFIRRYGEEELPSTADHPVVDLREYVVHIFEQDDLGSCTANVICAAYEFIVQKQARKLNYYHYNFNASRLFVYYNTRKLTSTTEEDSGGTLYDSLLSIYQWGVCHEDLWPYIIRDFTKEPPRACYIDAEGNKITAYYHLKQEKHQLRACLKEGFPFAFLFELFDSFDINMTDDGQMPLPSEEEIRDGATYNHAVLCVGYNDNTECFTVLNSWGSDFGDGGYVYMPYKYVLDSERAFNFWKISDASEMGLNSTYK